MCKSPFLPILISFCLINFSCNKTGGKVTTYTVSDYKTNKPIEGASVNFYSTGGFDPNCFCFTEHLQTTKLTDQNGQCRMSEEEFTVRSNQIIINKDQYWSLTSISNPPEINYALEPVGQIQIHLTRTNVYSGPIYIGISCAGEKPGSPGVPFPLFPAPADSLFSMPAFAEETNKISWSAYDSTQQRVIISGGPLIVQVPLTGSVRQEINY